MQTKFSSYKRQIRNNMIYYYLFGKKKLIMKYYNIKKGYTYDFDNPKLFTEKINSRKADNNPIYTLCADKINVREYVSKKIGKEYLIPVYFTANKLTSSLYDRMPNQCVLKTASGSGTIKIIYDKKNENKEQILKLMRKYQKVKFHYIWGEMFYKNIKNNIICEKLLLTDDGKVPTDIKVHCFRNGYKNPKFFVQLEFDRFGDHRRNIYDEKFNLLDLTTGLNRYEKKVNKPKNWNEIIEISKKLSEDFDYVRVDLYDFKGKIYFGELTFTHNAGFTEFSDKKYNKLWGNYWK